MEERRREGRAPPSRTQPTGLRSLSVIDVFIIVMYTTIMGRGLSTSQRVILALLRGDEEGVVYVGLDRGCDTAELVEELGERGLVHERAPRKQQMFTVVRACRSLERRGLVSGEYVTDVEHPQCRTLHWSATE
jgi:hypothetical protein